MSQEQACPKEFKELVPRAGLSQAFERACPRSGPAPSIFKGILDYQSIDTFFTEIDERTSKECLAGISTGRILRNAPCEPSTVLSQKDYGTNPYVSVQFVYRASFI